MFGRKNLELKSEICRLENELFNQTRHKEMSFRETKEWRTRAQQAEKMADQRMQTIETQRVSLRENEIEIDNLQRSKNDLRKENRQLREGVGHALHALAAVQDLSTAFVKRLDMLPPYCGLPKDLVESVFADFDTDLHARKDLARELEKQSFTYKAYADDNDVLQNGVDDNTRFVNVEEIRNVIFGPNSHINTDFDTNEFEIKDQKIHELGLYTIEIDLGKGVITQPKLWVVPSAEGLTP